MLISENNEKIYFKEFVCNQERIWTKYDSLEKGLSLKASEKEFINNFDRYILHTLEEVYEVQDAKKDDNKSFTDYLEELVDVTMYTGTMYSIVNENFRELYSQEEYYFFSKTREEIEIKCIDLPLDQLCLKVLNNLIITRTFFKKRKWHKISEEMDLNQKKSALEQVEKLLFETIMLLLGFIKNEIRDQNYGMNSLIEVKQNLVFMLSGVNS